MKKIKMFAGKLKCFFGIHDWYSYGANVDADCSLITLVWWQCERCAESRLKCILHNEKSKLM